MSFLFLLEFLLALACVIPVFMEINAFFSELCHHFPSTLNGYSGSAHPHRMKEASARGNRVHGPFFPCVYFRFSFTAVHKLLDASDIDGIICIVLWR